MSLWGRIAGEFIDVIEWKDDSANTLVWRFERFNDAIKYGAKLTVREGQVAVFVSEGQIADVYPPGLYQLETRNMPIMTTLQHWDHGFNSPFKAEVYFVSTRRFTDQKWGTRNPVTLRDPEFGPVRLRAFGTYTMRVADAALFMREIVGTDGHFTTDEISEQLRNLIVARMSEALATSGIPILDLAASYDKLGAFVTDRIGPVVEQGYGIRLDQLMVENVSLPPEVEAALDKRTSMGVIGDLDRYTRFQAAEALGKSGADGTVGAGIGLGAGMAMAQQVAGAFGKGAAAPGQATARTARASRRSWAGRSWGVASAANHRGGAMRRRGTSAACGWSHRTCTSPAVRARALRRVQAAKAACLCGTVTLAPRPPRAAKASRAAGSAPGSTSRPTYSIAMPVWRAKAAWICGEGDLATDRPNSA